MLQKEHLAALPNQTTSVHHDNQWLFPGRRRNASLRALVLELPAPVVADSLNCSYQVADKHRQNAGATFIDCATRRNGR